MAKKSQKNKEKWMAAALVYSIYMTHEIPLWADNSAGAGELALTMR